MLDQWWAAGLHLSHDESASSCVWKLAPKSLGFCPGLVPTGMLLVNEYLGYLADRNYSPRTLRAYGYDLLAFCRWLDSVDVELEVGEHRDRARLHAVLPPDADRGTSRQCCVDDRQAPRPLFLDHHQSPSGCFDGFVHLPHAA